MGHGYRASKRGKRKVQIYMFRDDPSMVVHVSDLSSVPLQAAFQSTTTFYSLLRSHAIDMLRFVSYRDALIHALDSVSPSLMYYTALCFLACFLSFFYFKSCLTSIYNLSVMTDPPQMFPHGALSLHLRLDAVATPKPLYGLLTPYLSLSAFSRRSCFCIIFGL